MSEHSIPPHEQSDWNSNPYERMRSLYPPLKSPQQIRDIVEKEAYYLYIDTPFVKSLFGFAFAYAEGVTAQLDTTGYTFPPEAVVQLKDSCAYGALVAIDVNAHVLSDEDRSELYGERFNFKTEHDVVVNSPENLMALVSGKALDIAEEIETRPQNNNLVPEEVMNIGRVLFEDSHSSFAVLQERAFFVGASMVYDRLGEIVQTPAIVTQSAQVVQ